MNETITYIYIYSVTHKKPNKIIAHFNMHTEIEISAVYLWLISSVTKEHASTFNLTHIPRCSAYCVLHLVDITQLSYMIYTVICCFHSFTGNWMQLSYDV